MNDQQSIPKIIVFGDLMLDKYVEGDVTRISPEAPVQVLNKQKEYFRLGGAANVLKNLINLNCITVPIGIIGNDSDGDLLLSLLEESKIDVSAILKDENRPTTTKFRVVSNGHQLLRIDSEKTDEIDENVKDKLLDFLKNEIIKCNVVILEDYNKGLLSSELIQETIKLATKYDKITAVDPKLNNLTSYKGCTVFKPNKREAEQITQILIRRNDDIIKIADKIFHDLAPKYLLITLAEDGMVLFDNNLIPKHFETQARKVSDVSGAGDTVISVLTAALAKGYEIDEAVELANKAAGHVVEKAGVVPIDNSKIKI